MNKQNNQDNDNGYSIARGKDRIVLGIRKVIDILTASLALLGTVVTLIYIALASVTGLPLPSFALTDTQKIAIIVYLFGLIFLYFPVVKGIKKIWQPPVEHVQLVDGASEKVVDHWKGHPELVEDMEKVDGQIETKKIHGEIVHLVNYFDPDKNEAKGPRKSELPDWDMVSAPEMIERQRHRNSEIIERAKVISKFLPDIVQNIESDYYSTLSNIDIEDTAIEADDFISQLQDELPEVREVDPQAEDVDDIDRDRSVLDEDKGEGDNDE